MQELQNNIEMALAIQSYLKEREVKAWDGKKETAPSQRHYEMNRHERRKLAVTNKKRTNA